jgi:hypothetical protein
LSYGTGNLETYVKYLANDILHGNAREETRPGRLTLVIGGGNCTSYEYTISERTLQAFQSALKEKGVGNPFCLVMVGEEESPTLLWLYNRYEIQESWRPEHMGFFAPRHFDNLDQYSRFARIVGATEDEAEEAADHAREIGNGYKWAQVKGPNGTACWFVGNVDTPQALEAFEVQMIELMLEMQPVRTFTVQDKIGR